MRKILSHFDKSAINDLPAELFAGRIVVVDTEEEAEKAVAYLLDQPVLGFDTETKPCFKRGEGHKVALLQVSGRDTCFLFRLNRMDLPDCLVRLLSDRKVLKIGLSWHDDLIMLHRRREFKAGTFVELQTLAAGMGITDMSLQKLYANLFEQKISKSQRLTNWEADTLTERQKRYAATDAWACIHLYEGLTRLKKEGYELVEPDTHDEQANHTAQG